MTALSVLRSVASVGFRDLCLWLGLALLVAGLASWISWSIAATVAGAVLVLIAVFGVADTGLPVASSAGPESPATTPPEAR